MGITWESQTSVTLADHEKPVRVRVSARVRVRVSARVSARVRVRVRVMLADH